MSDQAPNSPSAWSVKPPSSSRPKSPPATWAAARSPSSPRPRWCASWSAPRSTAWRRTWRPASSPWARWSTSSTWPPRRSAPPSPPAPSCSRWTAAGCLFKVSRARRHGPDRRGDARARADRPGEVRAAGRGETEGLRQRLEPAEPVNLSLGLHRAPPNTPAQSPAARAARWTRARGSCTGRPRAAAMTSRSTLFTRSGVPPGCPFAAVAVVRSRPTGWSRPGPDRSPGWDRCWGCRDSPSRPA